MKTAQNTSLGDVHLREEATEQRVKEINLERYRVVAFAAHGLFGDGPFESGLVLTGGRMNGANDDGFLGASEIAELELDTHCVILAACDTGAPDWRTLATGISSVTIVCPGVTWLPYQDQTPHSKWITRVAGVYVSFLLIFSDFWSANVYGRTPDNA